MLLLLMLLLQLLLLLLLMLWLLLLLLLLLLFNRCECFLVALVDINQPFSFSVKFYFPNNVFSAGGCCFFSCCCFYKEATFQQLYLPANASKKRFLII